jgi:hypothetical protein
MANIEKRIGAKTELVNDLFLIEVSRDEKISLRKLSN